MQLAREIEQRKMLLLKFRDIDTEIGRGVVMTKQFSVVFLSNLEIASS